MGYEPSAAELPPSISTKHICLTPASDRRNSVAADDCADFLEYFDDVFLETSAKKRQELERAFRLRYQVYCLDRHFEEAAACPDGMERDRFDDYAYHSLLSCRAQREDLGTVRLVRPPAHPSWITKLPLAEYAGIENIGDLMHLPAGQTAEVSRFAIARTARRLLTQRTHVSDSVPGEFAGNPALRLLPYMSLGLIRGLVRLSRDHGITHWCLAAEPSLLRRLRAFGLHFKTAGPLVEHRGLRQICYAELGNLLQRAKEEQPECWAIMTGRGTLTPSYVKQNAA